MKRAVKPFRSVRPRLFGLAIAAAACNQLLSIDEAKVDPTLASGGAPGAGSSGDGGSAATNAGNQSERGGAAPSGSGGGANASGGPGTGAAGDGGASSGAGGAGAEGPENTGGQTSGGDAAGGMAGAGASTNGEAGSAGAPTVSLCEEYCSLITEYCVGNALQYRDKEQCIKVCDMFPEGTVGGPDGHDVACRLKYAGKARYAGGTELQAYCRQAGPGGNGRCGSNCDGFCDITMATCTEAETAPYFFPSRSACQSKCSTLPEVPFVYGADSSADGNTVECRLFHVMYAAMLDPEEHCAHAMGVTLCEPN